MNSSNIFKIDTNQSIGTLSGAYDNSTTTTTGINGMWQYYYPHYQPINYLNYYQTQLPVKYDVQIQKVENGWIVHKDNKQYVCTKAEQIVKYLTEES